MAVDPSTFPGNFDTSLPANSDQKAEGAANFRQVKTALKNAFPNVTGAVTPTHTVLNYMLGVTSAVQTQLDAKAPLASPALTGTPTAPTAAVDTNTTQVATTAYVVGQAYAKLASPALTGTPTAPTAASGTSTTQIATTAFVQAAAFNSALPAQAGNSGKFVTTDGTNASWADAVTPTGIQTLTNKTINGASNTITNVPLATGVVGTLPVANGGTGQSSLTAYAPIFGGTTGTGGVQSGTVGTLGQVLTSNGPGALPTFQTTPASALVLLSAVTASGSATVDLETTFSSTYDAYLIVCSGVRPSVDGSQLYLRMKLGGAYDSGSNYYYTVENTASSTAAGTYSSANQTAVAQILIADFVGTTAGYCANSTITLMNAASTSLRKLVEFRTATQVTGTQIRKGHGVGGNTATSALTGVRFLMDSGNIDSGTFRLYGISNS